MKWKLIFLYALLFLGLNEYFTLDWFSHFETKEDNYLIIDRFKLLLCIWHDLLV